MFGPNQETDKNERERKKWCMLEAAIKSGDKGKEAIENARLYLKYIEEG